MTPLPRWAVELRLGEKSRCLAQDLVSATIRANILKLAAVVSISARRVWLAFAASYPHQAAFATAPQRLRDGPVPDPPG